MERKLSNGMWVEAEDRFLDMAANFHGTTSSKIREQLDQGQEIRYRAGDWYPHIRNTPQPQQRQVPQMVRADCGHLTHSPMSTSQGTSCSMCYDRMSD